jgi:thioredoxin reductase (NADPH)
MSAKDVIVIGAGVAGLTAAKLAAQQGYSVINFESVVFGGLVLNINELDGEPHGSGAEFASTLLMDITDLGVESLNETVTGLARKGNVIEVTTDQGSHQARVVVVASGALGWLGSAISVIRHLRAIEPR